MSVYSADVERRLGSPMRGKDTDVAGLNSMTGFARAEGSDEGAAWAWEVRSVNGRSLDVRCRLPSGLDRLERPVRTAVAARFKRGSVSATLSLSWAAGARHYEINRPLLDKIRELATEMGTPAPGLESLVGVRGLFEPLEANSDHDARDAAITATLTGALDALARMRSDEGTALATVLDERLDAVAGLIIQAEASAAAQPEAIRERLQGLVTELLEAEPGLPEERLAQEAAILVGKADVREELDRLNAHVAAIRALLTNSDAVGRRLDFLCQELNREVNTLCAKAADVALTRIGLDLKAAVEQLREQVQNIE